MKTLTREQSRALKRLAKRIYDIRQAQCTVRVIYVPPYNNVVPGAVTITASTKENYERLLRMVRRIVPEVKMAYEHGVGWHWMDRTPYYHGEFTFMLLD